MAEKKAIGQVLIELSATTAKLQADFAKATGYLKKFKRDVGEIKHVLETVFVVKGVEFAIEKIKGLGEGLKQVAEAGAKASGIKDAFAALGGQSSTIEEAKQRVLGLVDAFDLMTDANKGLVAQIPNFQKHFAEIADLGGRLAKVLGIDTKQSVDDLTEAIVRGNAKALKPLGFTFTDTKNKAQVAQQALSQLAGLASNLPKPVESVSTAFTGLANAWSEVGKQFAMQLNQSPELLRALKDLQGVVATINVADLATSVADLATVFVRLATEALPKVVELIHAMTRDLLILGNVADDVGSRFGDVGNQISEGFKKGFSSQTILSSMPFFGPIFQQMGDKTIAAIDNSVINPVREKLVELRGLVAHGFGQALSPANVMNEMIPGSGTAAKAVIGRFGEMFDAAAKKADAFLAEQKKVQAAAAAPEKPTKKLWSAGLVQGADAALQKLQQLREELAKFDDANTLDKLKGSFETSLQQGNIQAADSFLAQYKEKIDLAAADYFKKFTDVGITISDQQLQDWKDKFIIPAMQQELEARKRMFDESVQFFGGILDDLLSGQAIDWKAMFKKVAVDFGAQMLASLTNSFSLQGNLGGLLASLAGFGGPAGSGSIIQGAAGGGIQGLIGAGGAGLVSSLIGSAPITGAAAQAAGLAGPAMASGMFSAGSGMLGAASMIPGWGWALGGAALLGGSMFGDQIGGLFGGSKDQGTMDRDKAFSFLSDKLGKGFSVPKGNAFGAGGKGFDFFNKMGTEGKNAFGGLGDGLQELLGLTENIGPQIGAIIAENLTGNLDKAKAMTKELGFSQEELEAAVIKAGLKMGKTWLEIQGELQGVAELFTPGVAAVGDLKGAMDELAQSGGKGLQALQAIRDVAVEGAEKGINTLDDLKNNLMKIWNPKDVDIFFAALKAFGINSLDDLKNVSDKTAIAIIAQMTAAGFVFDDLGNHIDNVINKFHDLTSAAQDAQNAAEGASNTNSGQSPQGQPTGQGARGAIVHKRSLMLTGELGPEAILPLTRVGGVLGVHARGVGGAGKGGMTIMIDARGAHPGVEAQIQDAVEEALARATPEMLELAVSAVHRDRLLNRSLS